MSVIAHRGASGHAPENTIRAFRLARALGADGVELDVHATADGELVVHHDAEVPGLGPIPRLELARVRGAPVAGGEPLPTLAEALRELDGLDVYVEVKTLDPRWDRRLLDVLAAGPTPERYAVHGFDHRIVRRLGDALPSLRRGILLSSYLVDPVSALEAAGADTLWQEWHQIDVPLVEAVHASGRRIVAWTVNAEDAADRLVAMGVDALCGNYPDRLRAVAARAAP